MALRFGKKKPDEDSDGQSPKEPAPFEPQPEKARKWFDHGRAAADSYQFDYALHSYASGIRLDPITMSAHEAMFAAAVQYGNRGGKPASGKEIRSLDGPHPVDKFACAEFAWCKDLGNAQLALKFLDVAVKAEEWAGEVARWHATRVLNVLRNQKKKSKTSLLQAKDLLAALGAWHQSIAAAEEALQLDSTDATLGAEIKDLSAQRAMDEGGYNEAGTEGGFRAMVKDIDKQRELEEAEAISGGLSIDQRNLERAKREYEEGPEVPDSINKYAQLLKAQATPESEEMAYDVAMTGFNKTGQYRFRAFAGDIRIDQKQRRVDALAAELDGTVDAGTKTELDECRHELLELQYAEYVERVAKYPTDRLIKLQLGQVEFGRANYEKAMECFQQARDEPRIRVRAGYMLGRCFAAVGWHMEAIEEYKAALDGVDAGDRDTELAVRYDLMVSLMEHARQERDLDLARESLTICSSIARKDISYRDIRECRKQVDQLVKELSA